MGTASKKDNNIQSSRRFPVCWNETCRDKPRKQTTWSGGKNLSTGKGLRERLDYCAPLPRGQEGWDEINFFLKFSRVAMRVFSHDRQLYMRQCAVWISDAAYG
jgi:hypothetical protein